VSGVYRTPAPPPERPADAPRYPWIDNEDHSNRCPICGRGRAAVGMLGFTYRIYALVGGSPGGEPCNYAPRRWWQWRAPRACWDTEPHTHARCQSCGLTFKMEPPPKGKRSG